MKTSLHQMVKDVSWKDLSKLAPKEIFIENTIIIPWLVITMLLAGFKLYWLAVPCSFVLFLTALRQAHNGFHYTLGISNKWTDMSLHFLSLVMICSMHAVKYNHLMHHKHCLTEKDHEGAAARMSALRAILHGPVHVVMMHYYALKNGNPKMRRQVIIDLILIAAFITVAMVFKIELMLYHIIIMSIGECFSAFFAVWTVHHHCDEFLFARTLRKKWSNWMTYNMFYHMEHHLFPKVPTIKLPELAKRIDKALPEIEWKEVF